MHYALARNGSGGHTEGMHSTKQFSREFTDDGLPKQEALGQIEEIIKGGYVFTQKHKARSGAGL